MARVSFFIDGFNVYHSLKNPPFPPNKPFLKNRYQKYLWLDFYTLAERFTRKGDAIADVFYFSAFATWRPNAMKRHKQFIDALENKGVRIIMGEFKEKDRFCTNCRAYSKGHEEKQTDVNIGIYLLNEAYKDSYDTAVILTNDTDLIPAIRMVKDIFSDKKIGVLFPIDRWSSELAPGCTFWRKIRKKDLSKSQLPENVTLPSGVMLTRPPSWK